MKERPILFNGAMVRAILDGSKTQTRRIVKPQPDEVETYLWASGALAGKPYQILRCYNPPKRLKPCASGWSAACPGPYNPPGNIGDRLWVRECFAAWWDTATKTRSHVMGYRADIDDPGWEGFGYDNPWWLDAKWEPSIHMPRAFSRITLEIVNVRVERLQNITPADAIAEGIAPVSYHDLDCESRNPVHDFRSLWESINGDGSWLANPWVWVIEFKRIGGEG